MYTSLHRSFLIAVLVTPSVCFNGRRLRGSRPDVRPSSARGREGFRLSKATVSRDGTQADQGGETRLYDVEISNQGKQAWEAPAARPQPAKAQDRHPKLEDVSVIMGANGR